MSDPSQFSDEDLKRISGNTTGGSVTTALACEVIRLRERNAWLNAELDKANKIEENLLVTGQELAEQPE